MAQIETWVDCYLGGLVQIQYLEGNVFSMDKMGNRIGVNVYDIDGNVADITGTVTAHVIRSDGNTVAVTGSRDGNKCWVDLPQACYYCPGTLVIVIKLTSGTTITTLACVVSNVYQSYTGSTVDPGTIVTSIEDLITAINTAVAGIPLDWAKLAPAFSDSTSYVAGQYCTYNSNLYRFTSAHSGSWNASHVAAVTVGGELTDLKSAFISNKYDVEVTALQSNTDFNNLTTPGNYKVLSSTAANTMVHIPAYVAGRLLVGTTYDSDRIIQIYITFNGIVYKRIGRSSDNFGDWSSYDNDIATLMSDVTQLNTDIVSSGLASKQIISGFSDYMLDDSSVSILGLGNAGFSGLGNYSVSVGDDYIQISPTNSYISREFIAQRDGTIYFGDDVLDATYVALAVGHAPVGTWYDSSSNKRINASNPVRYRKSESNIPTSSNPMMIYAGDILVLTLPSSGLGALYVYGSLFNHKINSDIELPSDLKTKQIKKTSATNYDIQIGAFEFHYTQVTTGSYTRWNLLGVELGETTIVTDATDIIGPIRESNNNYIGGVHGYENTTDMKIYADGKLLSLDVNESVDFATLDIVHESILTSTVNNTEAWKRLYHLAFNDTGIKIDNNYTCLANEQVIKRATNGGIWGSPNTVVTAIISTNKFFSSPPTSDSTTTTYFEDETDGCTYLYSAGHTVTMRNTKGHEKAGYKAIYTVYGTETPKRTKVYFLVLDESTTFNIGDVIYGGFELLLN